MSGRKKMILHNAFTVYPIGTCGIRYLECTMKINALLTEAQIGIKAFCVRILFIENHNPNVMYMYIVFEFLSFLISASGSHSISS